MAIKGKEKDLGFQLSRRRSRRVGPETVTDFDFADDIALLSEELYQAQELLHRVETSVAKVGLKMNAAKTQFMSFNQSRMGSLQTNDGTKLEEVKDFKYLGVWLESTAKDIKQRKQQRGEHAVNCPKSGSHPSLEDSSYVYLQQLCSQCYYMAVKLGLVDYHAQNRKEAWWLLHTHAKNSPEWPLETAHDKCWTVWQTPKDQPKDTRKKD